MVLSKGHSFCVHNIDIYAFPIHLTDCHAVLFMCNCGFLCVTRPLSRNLQRPECNNLSLIVIDSRPSRTNKAEIGLFVNSFIISLAAAFDNDRARAPRGRWTCHQPARCDGERAADAP
jgi:hypothetical protein